MTVAEPQPVHPDIPAEQGHLTGTVQAMLRQIDAWEDRERNVGADLETSLTLADEAEEKAAMLAVHVHEPYFGSLKVRVGGREQLLYVGKHAFRDLQGPHTVVSWQSEVGGQFYSQALSWQTPKGLTGTVRRRRQLDVQRKTLKGLNDLYDDEAGGETGGRERVLISRLSEAASTGMRDVVETLQPEQNEAMRAPAGTALLIQGAAGSGKTTIGFHRLAWMMHPERGEHRATPDDCLVLMPNAVLAAYAARVLPGLDLQGVNVTTPEAWALAFLGLEKMEVTDRTLTLLLQDRDNERRRAAWRRAKALGDAKMLQVVRRHLASRLAANVARLDYQSSAEVGGQSRSVHLSAASLQAMLDTVQRLSPLEGYRPAFRAAVQAEVLAQLGSASEGEDTRLLRILGLEIGALVGKVFAGLLPVSEAKRLITDGASLRAAAGGLLGEATIGVILGDPLSGVAKPRRSHADVTEIPLMLAVSALLDGIGRRVGRDLTAYSHIVLDEAQDYPPVLYALLARAARPGHITALGDLNQGLHGYKGPGKWADVQAALEGVGSVQPPSTQPKTTQPPSARPPRLMTLSRTYRSTRQITQLSAQVAATYNRAAEVLGVDRDGEEVQRLTGGPLAVLCAAAVKTMQRCGHTNIAVVTRRVTDAERLAAELRREDVDAQPILNDLARYRGGVVILPVNLAKGLEFDGCVVAGADAEGFDPATEFEARLLYVAVSRGLHALALCAEETLHPLLA